MTDEEILAYATKRRRDATRLSDLDFWDWVIGKARAGAGRLVTEPSGTRPVRSRAQYMKKWRQKRAAEIAALKAKAEEQGKS